MINKNTLVQSLFLGFFLTPLLASSSLMQEEKVEHIKSSSLYGMQYLPCDVECLLLANHVYGEKIKSGDVVHYTGSDLFKEVRKEENKKQTSYFSYLTLSFAVQICLTAYFIYDLYNYISKIIKIYDLRKIAFWLGVAIILFDLIGLVMVWGNSILWLVLEKEPTKSITSKRVKNQNFENFNHQNWQVEKVYKSKKFKEYQSVLYMNQTKTKMILSIQGTNSWRDWWYTNWPAVKYQQPKGQVKLILELVEDVVAMAKKYTISMVTITGHSLGGFLAQIAKLLADMHFDQENMHFRAICFDAPGAKEILNKVNCNTENNRIDLATTDIINYVSSPNLINATRDSTGSIYMIPGKSMFELKELIKSYIFYAKVFFYVPLYFLCKYFITSLELLNLDSIKKMLANIFFTRDNQTETTEYNSIIISKQLIFSLFIVILLVPWWAFKTRHNWIPKTEDFFWSFYTHAVSVFIENSNIGTGSINGVEVSFFPKYGELSQGPGDLFPILPETQDRYARNLRKNRMGICYVKNKNNNRAQFIHMRNVLPEVNLFLQQMDKNYPDAHTREGVLEGLDLPIRYVYNKQGILIGLESASDTDIRIVIDRCIALIRKKQSSKV